MKLQNLAVIFVAIMLPITIVLSAYTRNQIKTLNLQTSYDSKLVDSTYDAVKAFQLNTISNTSSDIAESKIRDINASVNVFFNSVADNFGLSGYNADTIKDYVPAVVYTLYDGYYIYSPYTNNINGINVNGDSTYKNGNTIIGLKPYVYYSCRYVKGSIDVVITYTLDNYITVQGKIGNEYVNKSGYLLDNVTDIKQNSIKYRGIEINKETNSDVSENVVTSSNTAKKLQYVQINGVKYYKESDTKIFSIVNGEKIYLSTNSTKEYKDKYFNGNDSAINYYKKAYEFTNWVKDKLGTLRYEDSVDERGNKITDSNGNSVNGLSGNTYIFKDDKHSIEDADSNFNEHRVAVIRYSIQKNLSIAISNYNHYSKSNNEFQMPELSETDWYRIINNVSVISFLQGLSIGGKMYNGYAVVTNNKTQEVVSEDSIYIINGNQYSKVNETGLNSKSNLIGFFNVDFEQKLYTVDKKKYYYYPHNQIGSYSSIVNSTGIEEYTDIHDYLKGKTNLAKAYYTALGRERYGMYRVNYYNYIK